ncbi:carotenoid oxygenase [Chytridium lagenaria]|nr:carotenoid oxygenase [Chytridium lagenaria]
MHLTRNAQSDPEAVDFEAGFKNCPEKIIPVKLDVKGTIPSWIRGHLYRVAPSTFEIELSDAGKKASGKDSIKISHWFDGVTHIHKFTILPDGSVEYMNRKTGVAFEEQTRKTGAVGMTFGQRDPCKTFFSRIYSIANLMISTPDLSTTNVGVTISPNFVLSDPSITNNDGEKGPKTLVVKTDATMLHELDPVSLAPLKIITYSDINKNFDGVSSASHGHYDADTKEYFNFAIDMAAKPTFKAFKITDENPSGEVIAKIPNSPSTYMHSFALTDKYAVFPFETFKPLLFVVVDREAKKHVATYRCKTVFGFHVINAWDDGDDIVFDISVASDASTIYDLYLNNGYADLKSEWLRPHRFRLPNVSEVITSGVTAVPGIFQAASEKMATVLPEASMTKLSHVSLELPRYNLSKHRKPNRYAYGVSILKSNPELYATIPDEYKSAATFYDAFVKMDLSVAPAKHTVWYESGTYPGEPVFLARPGTVDEDDGILLSVVMRGPRAGTGSPSSFLLVLNASDMKEVARAEMPEPFVIPFGFHGNFYATGAPTDVGEQ